MGEVAKVIPIRRGKAGKVPMPEAFEGEDLRRLLRLALKDGRTVEEVSYACDTARFWARQGKTQIDWVIAVIGYMRNGWALRGFASWWSRTQGHRGKPPGTRLTEELIEAILAKREQG